MVTITLSGEEVDLLLTGLRCIEGRNIFNFYKTVNMSWRKAEKMKEELRGKLKRAMFGV